MIKASSLFYAIVISILIAIISSALILFSYLSNIQFQDSLIIQRLNLNADSGINILLSKQSVVSLNEKSSFDLYNEGIDSIELTRKSWGAHEIAISKAFFKKNKIVRIAETGYFQDSTKTYSIYLADQDKPLALCGNTFIKGTAYLPKSGVKRAYIEGQNFTGNELIHGNIKTSEKTLAEFNHELIKSIEKVFANKFLSNNDSIIKLEDDLSLDTLNNSFLNPTILFSSSTPLKISEGNYSGNIAFISDKKITISSNVIMNDVVLYAPKIIIEEGFKGNIQAFASDTIILAKNVTLNYPSVLGIVVTNKSPLVSVIITNENDTISGSTFACRNTAEQLKQCGVIIKNKTIVIGQVYSNGYADIQGTINGNLMCNKIILSTPSSVYENHLLNSTIDFTKLSKYYASINLLEESKNKKVVKWFY